MKAWELRGFGRENLALTDKPVPQPGPKDVLVRVSAVSLNYRDKLLVEGFYNPRMPFPMIQVADAVGEIVDGGKKRHAVQDRREGDRLVPTRWIDGEPQEDESAYLLGSTIPGALAEYPVLDQEALVHAPGYLSDEEAAAISCAGITAWYSLVERGGLKANQTVLIQGTGGVSLFGLQIGSALGARVIVTSSSDEKLARVTELGAWQGINYTRTPEWEKEVLRLTSEKGVDQILEVAGGKSLAQSITAVKGGRDYFCDWNTGWRLVRGANLSTIDQAGRSARDLSRPTASVGGYDSGIR